MVRLVSADCSPNYGYEVLLVLVDMSLNRDFLKTKDNLCLDVKLMIWGRNNERISETGMNSNAVL